MRDRLLGILVWAILIGSVVLIGGVAATDGQTVVDPSGSLVVIDPPEAAVDDPDGVEGDVLVLRITVLNDGDSPIERRLSVKDSTGESHSTNEPTTRLGPGEQTTLRIELVPVDTGEIDLWLVDFDENVLAEAGSIYVDAPPEDVDDAVPGFGPLAALLAVGILAAVHLVEHVRNR